MDIENSVVSGGGNTVFPTELYTIGAKSITVLLD